MNAPHKQSGQAMAEYLVVLGMVVAALLAVAAEPTVIQQIVDAIKSFFKAFSYVLSVAV